LWPGLGLDGVLLGAVGARYRKTALTASCCEQLRPGLGLDGVLLGAVGARYRKTALTASCWEQLRPFPGHDGILPGAVGARFRKTALAASCWLWCGQVQEHGQDGGLDGGFVGCLAVGWTAALSTSQSEPCQNPRTQASATLRRQRPPRQATRSPMTYLERCVVGIRRHPEHHQDHDDDGDNGATKAMALVAPLSPSSSWSWWCSGCRRIPTTHLSR